MTRPCVIKVLVPSNIGSARFSNTNATVVNWIDPILIDRSQDPNTLSAAPVTPWNRIPVLRKSVIPKLRASVALSAVQAAPESITVRIEACSEVSALATCSFARKHPDLLACK